MHNIAKEDPMQIQTIAIADATGHEHTERQCIDIEQTTRQEWDALRGSTLSSTDLGDEPGSRYLVQLVEDDRVIDEYEALSA